MIEHDIKVQPQFWPDLRDGKITAQLRRNDRKYSVGDVLLLREHNQSFGYTGQSCRRRVSHVLHNEDLPNGCPPGWVVLSMHHDAPALGNAELDAGAPNHDDPSKRGFDPR